MGITHFVKIHVVFEMVIAHLNGDNQYTIGHMNIDIG